MIFQVISRKPKHPSFPIAFGIIHLPCHPPLPRRARGILRLRSPPLNRLLRWPGNNWSHRENWINIPTRLGRQNFYFHSSISHHTQPDRSNHHLLVGLGTGPSTGSTVQSCNAGTGTPQAFAQRVLTPLRQMQPCGQDAMQR